ncbi:hypothetical protein [uncultured Cohaesibacter sp.]|uniref:hypothetical protein n=1 Tax=uncultured Cohaesibacter sp. TaxID=1002546 RepID=UPI002930EC35|nr:hypothetical protein [uncultured Cohaesibacter sp.]
MDYNPEIRQQLFEQFSQTVIADGWREVSCSAIAEKAGVDMKLAFVEYQDRYAYVTELVRRIDRAMIDAYDREMGEEAARDRLFDVIMARFETMQGYRALILALHKSTRRDPLLSLHLLSLSRLTGEWFLDISQISPAGLSGFARSKGVLLAYARAFATWMDDDSEDLAKTMAMLDKTLKAGEKAYQQAGKVVGGLSKMADRCRSSRKSSKKADGSEMNETSVTDGPSVDDGSISPMPS